jgi:23S rRNA (pseudouridine1915-N3)-methyltransferase
VRYLVLAVGRLRPPFTDDVAHYEKLLRRQARVEVVEVREDEALERRIPERAYVVLLDAGGRELSSEAFAAFWSSAGRPGSTWCSSSAGRSGPIWRATTRSSRSAR